MKVFLISAMVEGNGKRGHRASVNISDDEATALGIVLMELQKDGMSVVSFDIVEIRHVVPSPQKFEESGYENQD